MHIGLHVLATDGEEREITNIFVGENKERVYELDNKYLVYGHNFNVLEEE